MIIVIDGPAGSGKSSTARAVAEKLEIDYLNSGALYRAVTLLYLEANSEEQFFKKLDEVAISHKYVEGCFHIFIDDTDVTAQLRSTQVSEKVSVIASKPQVRLFVNALMKKAVKQGTYIAEGRDLGTAVFIDAGLKFYMSASIEERARRRYLELKDTETNITLEQVENNILNRDKKDSKRRNDPLKKASDSVEIDTSDLQFDEQVHQICSIITQRTDIKIKQ